MSSFHGFYCSPDNTEITREIRIFNSPICPILAASPRPSSDTCDVISRVERVPLVCANHGGTSEQLTYHLQNSHLCHSWLQSRRTVFIPHSHLCACLSITRHEGSGPVITLAAVWGEFSVLGWFTIRSDTEVKDEDHHQEVLETALWREVTSPESHKWVALFVVCFFSLIYNENTLNKHSIRRPICFLMALFKCIAFKVWCKPHYFLTQSLVTDTAAPLRVKKPRSCHHTAMVYDWYGSENRAM